MVGACYMHAFVEQGHSLVGLCELQPNAAVADAVQADQNQMPSAIGAVELAFRLWPSQWPVAKAMSIITKPLTAEAVPAACGNGVTALL